MSLMIEQKPNNIWVKEKEWPGMIEEGLELFKKWLQIKILLKNS